MDFERNLTRVENKNTLEIELERELTSLGSEIENNYRIFEPFCEDIDLKSLSKYGELISFQEAFKNFLQIRDSLIADEELIKRLSFEAYQKLQKISIDRLYLQKVTYEIEEKESREEIFKALNSQKSQAIYKKAFLNGDKIVSFSSTFGLWLIDETLFFKTTETGSNEKIRTSYTLRQLKYPSKKQDMNRLNYPIFEDISHLFENSVIEKFYKIAISEDGSLKADDNTLYALDYHFKSSLDEDSLKAIDIRQRALFEVAKETNHKEINSATKQDVMEMSQKNSIEIHTNYYSLDDTKYESEIDNLKKSNIDEYLKNQEAELNERQRKESQELKERVFKAKEIYKRAKEEFITALKSGANIDEAKAMLTSYKYNYITIELVMEEIKSDIILSTLKDEVIKAKQSNIDGLLKTNQSLNKKIEEAKEFLERANSDMELSLSAIAKLKDALIQKEAIINDLREERDELKEENEVFERELNLKFNQTKRKRLIKKYAKKIKSKK
jgi:hypothetical protein